MFDETQVESYKSIRAPKELKEKILATQVEKSKPYGKMIRICSVAASVLVIIGLGLLLTRKPVKQSVYIEDQKVNSAGITFTGVAMASLREMSVRIPLDFELEGQNTTIKVSEGNLFTDDDVDNGNTVVTDQNMRLWWVMSTVDQAKTYEMYVSSKRGNYIITLCCDDEGRFIIKKK